MARTDDPKIIGVIQARSGSSRLPNKVLEPLQADLRILDIIVEKVSSVLGVGSTILATTKDQEDDLVANVGRTAGVAVIRGSKEDVLSRFQSAIQETGADGCLRVCADNPLILRDDLKRLVQMWIHQPVDYLSFGINGVPTIRTHQGLWGEMIRGKILLELEHYPLRFSDREHVTQYVYTNPEEFSVRIVPYEDLPEILVKTRLTVDTIQDLENVKSVIAETRTLDPSLEEIVEALYRKPDLQRLMVEEIHNNSKSYS
jgi:spore coat polysaccharide biosynthesis protein SpsF